MNVFSIFAVFIECPLQFSRLTLNVDTGVSTIGFVENGDVEFEIAFEATSYQAHVGLVS